MVGLIKRTERRTRKVLDDEKGVKGTTRSIRGPMSGYGGGENKVEERDT